MIKFSSEHVIVVPTGVYKFNVGGSRIGSRGTLVLRTNTIYVRYECMACHVPHDI